MGLHGLLQGQLYLLQTTGMLESLPRSSLQLDCVTEGNRGREREIIRVRRMVGLIGLLIIGSPYAEFFTVLQTAFLYGLPEQIQATCNCRLVGICDKLQSFQFKSFNSVLFL
jgi:hypothetical protein